MIQVGLPHTRSSYNCTHSKRLICAISTRLNKGIRGLAWEFFASPSVPAKQSKSCLSSDSSIAESSPSFLQELWDRVFSSAWEFSSHKLVDWFLYIIVLTELDYFWGDLFRHVADISYSFKLYERIFRQIITIELLLQQYRLKDQASGSEIRV